MDLFSKTLYLGYQFTNNPCLHKVISTVSYFKIILLKSVEIIDSLVLFLLELFYENYLCLLKLGNMNFFYLIFLFIIYNFAFIYKTFFILQNKNLWIVLNSIWLKILIFLDEIYKIFNQFSSDKLENFLCFLFNLKYLPISYHLILLELEL